MPKKSKFELNQCVRIKKGHYEGELARIVRICETTGWINVVYASWGDTKKQDVQMGPYLESEVESISCKTFDKVRKDAVRDFEDSMGETTPEPEKPPRTSKKPAKTRKKRTRTVKTPPKEGNIPREEVRKAVRAARKKNREKQSLENFMDI